MRFLIVYILLAKLITPQLLSPFKAAFAKPLPGLRPPGGGPASELHGVPLGTAEHNILMGDCRSLKGTLGGLYLWLSQRQQHQELLGKRVPSTKMPSWRMWPSWEVLQQRCPGLQMWPGFLGRSLKRPRPQSARSPPRLLASGPGSENCCLPKDPAPRLAVWSDCLGTPKRPMFCFPPTLSLTRTAGRRIYSSHTKYPHTKLLLLRHLLLPLKKLLSLTESPGAPFSTWFASEAMTHLKIGLLKQQGWESLTSLERGNGCFVINRKVFPPCCL